MLILWLSYVLIYVTCEVHYRKHSLGIANHPGTAICCHLTSQAYCSTVGESPSYGNRAGGSKSRFDKSCCEQFHNTASCIHEDMQTPSRAPGEATHLELETCRSHHWVDTGSAEHCSHLQASQKWQCRETFSAVKFAAVHIVEQCQNCLMMALHSTTVPKATACGVCHLH